MALVMIFQSLASCGFSQGEAAAKAGPEAAPLSVQATEEAAMDAARDVISKASSSDETWAIYWYLCGSDLESDGGFATDDLFEMLDVDLPSNVRMVIQTGGSAYWKNGSISGRKIQRYLYCDQGLFLAEEKPRTNMGDPRTLEDFLIFCRDNYPADRTMMIFWNHGGGSVSGVSFDENYGYDSLTLNEMQAAFGNVYPLSETDPPFELIGFDACLMATIDVAYAFRNIGRYLVASQALEPGYGWDYDAWLEVLAQDPAMDGAQLGKAICDTFADSYRGKRTGDEITLSLTDLGAIGPLMDAYDAIGAEALLAAVQDPTFFSSLGRNAFNSENYGGNSKEEGYTNMVDLGHLVRNSRDLLPAYAQEVLNALDDCVLYQVKGLYCQEATGLSCYYSYNGDMRDFAGFEVIGASETFKYLYDYALTGTLSKEGQVYVTNLLQQNVTAQEVLTLENIGVDMDNLPVTIRNGKAVLDVGPEVAEILTGVYMYLAYVDLEEDLMLVLGEDNDLYADWDKGVFTDNFRGVWGAIDGHYVFMDLDYEGVDYNTYIVPILLNGENYCLRVAYDFNEGCYKILGARRSVEENGMADRDMRLLEPGDQITTLHYASSITGGDELERYEIETFTVTANTSFEELWLGDGEYWMMFMLEDAHNNTAWSELVRFEVKDDKITTHKVQ